MRAPLVITLILLGGMACAHRPPAAEPAPGTDTLAPASSIDAAAVGQLLADFRQAEALAGADQIEEANAIYRRLVNTPDVPRDVLAAAAVGLYRTGAFEDAVSSFRRLGAFGKGEEDLRYYYAVALYETGNFAEARKELSCALPFIQRTEGVESYRIRIEETAGQASR
jgi:Flp pilus assembly protein TadD